MLWFGNVVKEVNVILVYMFNIFKMFIKLNIKIVNNE